MHGNLQKVVALSPKPGAVTLLRTQGKVLVANDLRHLFERLFGFHELNLIYEPAVVYC